MSDVVARIRARFPRPEHADDGLLSNEAADYIEELEALVSAIMYLTERQSVTTLMDKRN